MPISVEQGPWIPLLRLRAIGNWVNLSTPLGLAVAALGRSTIRQHGHGLWLAEHYRLSFPMAGAFTIGNVVITAGEFEDLGRQFPRLLQHEIRHTWQYLYCLGLPYLVLYPASMAWSVLRTGDRASANVFEQQAGLAWGGYQERPLRPLSSALRFRVEATRASIRRALQV